MIIQSKVCLIIPSLCAGGMERVMSELSNYFCTQTELEVHLVMYGINPLIFYPVPSNLIIHTPDWTFDDSKRIWHTIRRLYYVRKTVKSIRPSTVLSFGEYWNSFVLLSLFGLKFPIFVSDRCQPNKSLGKFHDFLRQQIYLKAKGIIAQTVLAKVIYHKQIGHNNIEVIGNPIRSIESESALLQREKIVLSVGRLIETKHHDLLIDIFSKINKPDWKLIIVGGDAIKQRGMVKLSDKIRKLALEDRIILAGNCSDVDNYYLKSSIFAFTSSSEGFPNVLGEAMSAELPVVAFDCIAGPSDIILNGQNGFLVPLFDMDLFIQKLKFLMENEDIRQQMGKFARKSMAQFSAQTIGRKYYEFLIENV